MERWQRPWWIDVLRATFFVAGFAAIAYGLYMAFDTPAAGLGIVVSVGGTIPVVTAIKA